MDGFRWASRHQSRLMWGNSRLSSDTGLELSSPIEKDTLMQLVWIFQQLHILAARIRHCRITQRTLHDRVCHTHQW
ncbi:uncharacterized protein CANTADRAFT_219475 [Suhomyces tanzawaensis NRRL Y-17324]|uniref:Uncharacterized protein n=1 Tax=Suhomyces tanzawaensis NRRL Y-17324 TaxID=984487 RepID=A0A1E4SKA0_9ASCO|nr:uncharacterized protein CANTADRAFT_219475 [Suhomyces tanzawaensis NRRL Y-17324]ODV79936.1 hypothetical protein CANTADRAFT_219475 [Suhomyces tanzawaensis NRRL Y-17324]